MDNIEEKLQEYQKELNDAQVHCLRLEGAIAALNDILKSKEKSKE